MQINSEEIKSKLAQYLQQSESLSINPDQYDLALTRLGLDSVAAIGLGEFIQESFEVKAPQSLIFDHPSLNRIATFIVDAKKD